MNAGNSDYFQAESQRLLANMVMFGLISQTDHDHHKIRVKTGDNHSAWLPWPTEMGRNYRRWRPLRTGQQVILGCHNGDLSQAVVIGMLYNEALPPLSIDPLLDIIEFTNGDTVSHHIETGDTDLMVKGNLTFKSDKKITLEANDDIDIKTTGTLNIKASKHIENLG